MAVEGDIEAQVTGSEIQARLFLHVSPNAARNEVTGCVDGVWRVKVAAPPVKGRTNSELINFLSERLGVSKDQLSLLKGHTSKNKVVAIKGLSHEVVVKRLTSGLAR